MKSQAVQEIKSRLPLLEYIEGYIRVEKAGKSFKARCPFHNEKTPSFYISPERNTFFCFGCGKKGDIFSFTEEYEGLDFKETLKILAQKAGVSLESYNDISSQKDETTRQYEILESAANFFESELKRNEEAKTYLDARGVQQQTITKFRIGFAPKSWSSLYEHLKKKGFSDDEMQTSGLVKESTKKHLYDRFRGRIMFPFMDQSGRVIGFSGRIIDTNTEEAKYINSPESPLFVKSEVLYGLYQAKDSIRASKKVIIVEGQMDVVMSHQANLSCVVGSSGTAFTDKDVTHLGKISHLGMIKRLTDTVYLAFDNDTAGIKAMYRATHELLSKGFIVYCITIDGAKDFAELAQMSSQKLRQIIEKKEDAILFFTRYIVKFGDARRRAKQIQEKIWPLLSMLSGLDRSHLIVHMSKILEIQENVLQDDYNQYQKTKVEKKDQSQEVILENTIQASIFGKDMIVALVYYAQFVDDINMRQLIQKEIENVFSLEELEVLLSESVQNKEKYLFILEKIIPQKYTDKDILSIISRAISYVLKERIQAIKKEIYEKQQNNENTNYLLQEVALITQKIQTYEKSN